NCSRWRRASTWSTCRIAATDLPLQVCLVGRWTSCFLLWLRRSSTSDRVSCAGAMRSDATPDIPSIGEFIPGYEISTWYGVGAPKGTPAEIIDKLNKEINASLADPKLKARFAELGDIPMPMTPAEFGKFVADETEKLGKVVKFAGIKLE